METDLISDELKQLKKDQIEHEKLSKSLRVHLSHEFIFRLIKVIKALPDVILPGDSDVGDFMMVTDFQCWWQNHYVGAFIRYVVDLLNLLDRSPTS